MPSIPRDRIAEALFGKTKRNVLALLYGRPDSAFYLRQIARGREINPTIYRAVDLKAAVSNRRPFIRRVLEQPRIMLVGSEHDLAKLVGEPVVGRARPKP